MGKLFGEAKDNFSVGEDETNLIADADGKLRIVGAAEKNKHEKIVSDFRISITMYRNGEASGS